MRPCLTRFAIAMAPNNRDIKAETAIRIGAVFQSEWPILAVNSTEARATTSDAPT